MPDNEQMLPELYSGGEITEDGTIIDYLLEPSVPTAPETGPVPTDGNPILEDIFLSWEPHQGERGGKGWRSTVTGEIRYQQERPSEREEGQEEPTRQEPLKKKPAPRRKHFRDVAETSNLDRQMDAASLEKLKEIKKAISLTPAQDETVRYLRGLAQDDLVRMQTKDYLEYEVVIRKICSRLTEKASKKLMSNISSLYLLTSDEPVSEEYKKRSPSVGKDFEATGFYDWTKNEVWSDGKAIYGVGAENSRRGVLSHELGHALDGPGFRLSQSHEWQEAYRAEIGRGQLSNYAKVSSVEGFAEFARAVLGTDVPREEIEARFPKCVAFFKKEGLL